MQLRVMCLVLVGGLATAMLGKAGTTPADEGREAAPQNLLDLSGLAWIEDDLFLGVHDAKDNPEKHDWPRASLVRLPRSELEGVRWEVVPLEFPGPEGRGSDMESACKIPGGKGFLLCESGQEGEHDRRIFHAVFKDGRLGLSGHTTWPAPIHNVEGTEVCEVGGELIFMYAERAGGEPSTMLRWAPLSLDPLRIGAFQEVAYQAVDPVGEGARPIVGLDVDADGFIYSVSAYDSGSDDGPYRSVIWRIGQVTTDGQGEPTIELGDARRLATMDGLKVESVAVRELPDGTNQVFVGTDDEHFGGIIRPLP